MTLYGELFDKEGETIWDELLYMLTHPELEEEKLRKERQEKAYIDYVLEKGFSDTDETTEPYMSFEDFVRGKGVNQGVNEGVNQGDKLSVNNSLAPLNISNPQNPYDRINSDPNLTEEEKLSKILEVSRIQEEADKREKEINRQHAIEMAKDIGGAALEIGSAAVPGIGGAKVAGAVTKALAPKLGRKIANEIATGALKGLPSGFVEGLGRGLTEDENPFKTATQDSITGTVLGTAGGAFLGEAQKAIRGKELKNLDSLKKLRKKETEYYKNYIQGTHLNHPKIGKIIFTQSGLETVSKQPNAGRDFSSLKKDLSNAEYIDYEFPHHSKHGVKDDIKGFHKLKNDTKEFLIADTSDGPKYYMSKQIGDTNNRPSRVELASPHDIISNKTQTFNPSLSQEQSIQPVPPPESRENWLDSFCL